MDTPSYPQYTKTRSHARARKPRPPGPGHTRWRQLRTPPLRSALRGAPGDCESPAHAHGPGCHHRTHTYTHKHTHTHTHTHTQSHTHTLTHARARRVATPSHLLQELPKRNGRARAGGHAQRVKRPLQRGRSGGRRRHAAQRGHALRGPRRARVHESRDRRDCSAKLSVSRAQGGEGHEPSSPSSPSIAPRGASVSSSRRRSTLMTASATSGARASAPAIRSAPAGDPAGASRGRGRSTPSSAPATAAPAAAPPPPPPPTPIRLCIPPSSGPAHAAASTAATSATAAGRSHHTRGPAASRTSAPTHASGHRGAPCNGTTRSRP